MRSKKTSLILTFGNFWCASMNLTIFIEPQKLFENKFCMLLNQSGLHGSNDSKISFPKNPKLCFYIIFENTCFCLQKSEEKCFWRFNIKICSFWIYLNFWSCPKFSKTTIHDPWTFHFLKGNESTISSSNYLPLYNLGTFGHNTVFIALFFLWNP